MKVSPTSGTRVFRNRTSLAVEDGALLVTDRKGTARRFPLDAGSASPAKNVMVIPHSGPSQWAIVDGNGEVLVLGWVADWDFLETEEIDRAANLQKGVENRDTSKIKLRHDGLFLEDSSWWGKAPAAGSVAFVIAFLTQLGVVPAVVGWPIAAALMVFLVLGMTSGAYGKSRRGKGAAAQDAIGAGDDAAFDKAVDEALGTKTEEPDPPQAAT